MRPWIRRLFACMIVILSCVLFHTGEAESTSGPEMQGPLMQVYLIPFDSWTYTTVSMDIIHLVSTYRIWFMKERPSVWKKEHPVIAKLRSQLQSRPAPDKKIDDGFIRFRVDIGSQTFFVDINGIVLEKESGKTFVLSKAQRREIEKDIEYFSGIVDIQASKDVTLPK